jgi:hypothetical protein
MTLTVEFYVQIAEHWEKKAASLSDDDPEKAEVEALASSLRSTASLMAERNLGPYPVTPDSSQPSEAASE